MGHEAAHAGNGADPASGGVEYANRLEMLDEALEHVLLQLAESDFILTGPNGGVTRWGDRAKLLFGWETQRIVGSSLFETVLEGDEEGPVRQWERFLAEREGDTPPARFAVQARHCDGPELPLELTFVPVRLSQGSEFSFFVRDLTAELTQGAKLARLRRDHKDVLQSISSTLSHGTSLDPGERLAGVLVAYAATGPTPWVDSARRQADEAAAALAEAGEKGGEGAAADRMARTLAKAKRAERSADEARAEREALHQQLTTAVERSEQLEREGAAMRQALDDARRQANAADEHAESAQSEAESAHGDATQAIRLVRDLERQTQEVRGQLTQARGNSGEGAKRLAALERATEGATERLSRLEQRAREEAERLTRTEDGARGDAVRLEKLEREGEAELRRVAERLSGLVEQAEREGQAAGEEAHRLGERLDEALAELAQNRMGERMDDALEQLAEGREALRESREALAEAERAAAAPPAAADEARTETTRSAQESAQAREELSEVRQELAATKVEVGEARAELAEARELAAGVREVAASARAEAEAAARAGEQAREAAERARADAQAAGETGREATERGERALRLAGEAGERAEAAGGRAEDVRRLLEEVGGEVERAGAESSTTRDELASLRSEAEDVLRLLERSLGRALSGGPPPSEAWAERPAPPSSLPQAQPEAELEPTREPREGFDDVPAPMAMLDLEGRFLELNETFCELLGYSEREFTTAIWPSSLSDDATRREHRELRGRLAAGELDESPLETCYLHKEGLLVPVSGTVSLVRGEDGSPDHLLLSGAVDRAGLSA